MHIEALCMPDTHRGQKRVLDFLELELGVVVDCRVGVGNQTRVLCKNNIVLLNTQPSFQPQ